MVFQKRLDFNGYRATEMPRLPKSAKGKRSARRRVDENQMYAFDLLASVAGKILMDRESSFKSGDFDKIKQELLEEVKPYRDDAFDQASCNESKMNKQISPKQCDLIFKDPKVSPSSDLLEKDAKFGELAPICLKEAIADQTETREGTLEHPMVLDVIPSTLTSSNSSVEVPQSSDHDHHDNSSVCYSDNMEINIAGDDDDNMSRSSRPGTKTTRPSKAHRGGDRRIRKLVASKNLKAAKFLPRNGEFSNTEIEMKPIYRSRKLCCTHQRTQRSSFKRRKVLERYTLAALGAVAGWNGNCNVFDEEITAEVSNSHSAQREVNDALASTERSPYEADDCRVKLSIKSFKVPELFIEIPETATVGSLKRTVMEAVTALLGGGLRVGVHLQGKKVRDDNKTLHQAGISCHNKIDCVGFTLEPNPKAVPAKASPQLASPDMTCQLPCDAPRPLARIPPASPVPHSGASGTISEAPLVAPLVSIPESDHDSVQSGIVEGNSRALVPVSPANPESLSVVPMRKSRQSEFVQRRIRRPFSVAEVEALVQAVERLGTGRWRDVKLQAFDHAKHRTYVDLKDKWKTLVHTARISPQQRRGEPVPQELLDRVLAAQAYWSNQQAKLQAKPPLAEPCLLH